MRSMTCVKLRATSLRVVDLFWLSVVSAAHSVGNVQLELLGTLLGFAGKVLAREKTLNHLRGSRSRKSWRPDGHAANPEGDAHDSLKPAQTGTVLRTGAKAG